MRTALLLATLFIVGAVAAPTASADHVDCDENKLPDAACELIELHDAGDCVDPSDLKATLRDCLRYD